MITDQLVVASGTVSARSGDIHPRAQDGFYAHDTRFLSTLRLVLEYRGPEAVAAGRFDHTMASFYASSTSVRGLPAGAVSVVRDRYVSDGLHEDISLATTRPAP